MSEPYGLPGLSLPVAREIARSYKGRTVTQLQDSAMLEHEAALVPLSRLPIIPDKELQKLQQGLTAMARRAGYPASADAKSGRKLDLYSGVYLHTRLKATDTDLLRPETWAFLGTVVVPHIVRWRFPLSDEGRFVGPIVRNSLSRMWLATRLLDRGPDHPERWLYLGNATADFLVQLTERVSISSDRRVALTVAETWYGWGQRIPHSELELLNRNALKRLTFTLSTVEASLLSDTDLRALVSHCFIQARDAQTVDSGA